MLSLLERLVGTPKDHEKEKAKAEVVTTPEFDITQYAKKLGVTIASLAVVGAAALKAFDVPQTEGMVIAVLGIIAAAMLGVSLVMAVDLASRAYLTGAGAAEKEKEKKEAPADSDVVAVPAGSVVWLEDDDDPYPLLAIAHDGEKASSYLVASGSTVERNHGSKGVKAIDGAPKWRAADTVRAVKPAKWP